MSGSELMAWRQARGWTKYRLAKYLEVEQSSVVRWENGTYHVPRWVPRLLACEEAAGIMPTPAPRAAAEGG